MYNTIGVITNKPQSDILGELTKYRSINTVPFGGKYRLIDFALSNMVNTGLKTIGVVGSYKYKSLVDHLGTGQDWSLSRKSKSLSILNGGMNFHVGERPKINLMDFHANIDFFQDAPKKNIIISGSDLISNINYVSALDFHEQKKADVTMIYKEFDNNYCDFDEYDTMLDINKAFDRVTRVCNYPNNECNCLFLDMIIIKNELLLTIINDCDCMGVNWDLIEVIKNNIGQLNVFAFPHKGYFCKVNSIKKYFKCSMDLLKKEVKEQLLLHGDNIYTSVKDNHPTRYMKTCAAHNALVASGCILQGTIENSIIFGKVKIGEQSNVKNCVIMEKCNIGCNTALENVILDRDVTINDGVILKGKENAPIVIGKGCCLG